MLTKAKGAIKSITNKNVKHLCQTNKILEQK